MKETTEQLFLRWFAEQYECGLPDASIIRECMAYVTGVRDERHGDGANISNLNQCISVLQSFDVMVRALKQYEVKIRD